MNEQQVKDCETLAQLLLRETEGIEFGEVSIRLVFEDGTVRKLETAKTVILD